MGEILIFSSPSHGHEHCWHAYRGAIWMVVPDGHVVQKCCKCPMTRTIHADHTIGTSKEFQ